MRNFLSAAALFVALSAAAEPPGPATGLDEVRPPDTKATQGSLASVAGGLALTGPIVYMLFHAAHKRSKKS